MTGLEFIGVGLPWLGAFVGGAIVGSFLNVVIHRLPLMEVAEESDDALPSCLSAPFSLWWPPSHCPQCRVSIKLRHNVPLLGYAILGGRCADCGAAIPVRYPLVESAGVIVAVVALWQFGLTAQAALAAALLWALVCVSVIDIERLLIPDSLSGAILWTGLSASALGFWPLSAPDSVLGAVMGYSALRLLALSAHRLMGREAMGGGDPKLLAALGAWVGWQAEPAIFFIACAVGATTALGLMAIGRHHRDAPFPFGPALSLAGAGCVIAGKFPAFGINGLQMVALR